MRNYVRPGQILDVKNVTGSAVPAGGVIPAGDVVSVAALDAADGEVVAAAVEGVYELPKASGTAWSQGDPLSWDASANAFTPTAALSPASGDITNCAFAASDAGAASKTGQAVLANPGQRVG